MPQTAVPAGQPTHPRHDPQAVFEMGLICVPSLQVPEIRLADVSSKMPCEASSWRLPSVIGALTFGHIATARKEPHGPVSDVALPVKAPVTRLLQFRAIPLRAVSSPAPWDGSDLWESP